MNTDRQDYSQYNLLTPLAYGGVVEYNKSNQKKQNAQIRELVFLESNKSLLIEFGTIRDLSPYCKNTFGKKKLFGLMDFLFALSVRLTMKRSSRI